MFDKASLKLGLDKAVLQSMSGRENATNGVKQPCPSHSFILGPSYLANIQHLTIFKPQYLEHILSHFSLP